MFCVDKYISEPYNLTMQKIELFKQSLREHKTELIKKGYSKATIHGWLYYSRLPKFETAIELSQIIGLKINQIPYWRVERG